MRKHERNHKRYSFANAVIRFPGEGIPEGEIVNVSEGGFKILTNADLIKGDILKVEVDFRRVANLALSPDHFEIKIKIAWMYPLTPKEGVKNTYGASFTEVDNAEKKLLDSLFESLKKTEKSSDDEVDDVVREIDAFLEQFRKPE